MSMHRSSLFFLLLSLLLNVYSRVVLALRVQCLRLFELLCYYLCSTTAGRGLEVPLDLDVVYMLGSDVAALLHSQALFRCSQGLRVR